jgi:hypothetical protein
MMDEAATTSTAAAAATSTDDKVKVQFKAVGGAPLLKKTKFQVRRRLFSPRLT